MTAESPAEVVSEAMKGRLQDSGERGQLLVVLVRLRGQQVELVLQDLDGPLGSLEEGLGGQEAHKVERDSATIYGCTASNSET